MKFSILKAVMALLLAADLTTEAAVSYTSFGNGGTIPDGSLSGNYSTATVSGLVALSTISVTLNISGGYNGDLYAYLSYRDPSQANPSASIVLLNRVGVSSSNPFGSSLSGMTITLADDGALGNIHSYSGGTAPNGIFSADGRNIDPIIGPGHSSAGDFNASGTQRFDTTFAGMDPNGSWTLFIGDLSGGSVSMVNGWSLNITDVNGVPEPINVALGVFGGLFAAVAVGRRVRSRMQERAREREVSDAPGNWRKRGFWS